jgi:hypothetical protein
VAGDSFLFPQPQRIRAAARLDATDQHALAVLMLYINTL